MWSIGSEPQRHREKSQNKKNNQQDAKPQSHFAQERCIYTFWCVYAFVPLRLSASVVDFSFVVWPAAHGTRVSWAGAGYDRISK